MNWSQITLTALRIAIGWHFLYEGVYKVDSVTGAGLHQTSHYALETSTARLRDFFATADSGAFNLPAAFARADAWHDEIVRAFAAQKQLAEDQKARLGSLRDQVKLNAMAAARGELALDEVVNFDWTYVHAETLRVPPPVESEGFSALAYLQSSAGPARELFRGLVSDIDGLERLTLPGARALLERRFTEILEHYADAGQPFTAEQRDRLAQARDAIEASLSATLSSSGFQARLADYRALRQRVRADASRTNTPFSRERLDSDRKNLDLIAGELLAHVNEAASELAVKSHAIATVAQLGAGPAPREGLGVDAAVKYSLIAIGGCLMLGVFTPWAALAAAAQLALFYSASPPWPGYPAATLGGHYLYVDRNLIELFACTVIAAQAAGLRRASRSAGPKTSETL